MGFLEQVSLAAVAGVGVGAAFFALGSVAATVTPAISPVAYFAIGFGIAFAIAVSKATA